MRSEDALAATIGHEIAHVELRHCIERAHPPARERINQIQSLARSEHWPSYSLRPILADVSARPQRLTERHSKTSDSKTAN